MCVRERERHARGVPARRGRHGVPVAAPPKPRKKTVSAGPPVPSNSGGRRKRLPCAQIARGGRFHARDVPTRRGRHGVPVAAPPKPRKKTVSTGPPVPSNSGVRRKRLSRAQIAWGGRFHARDVPVRRGRHGVPVAAPPKPGKKTVSVGPPVPSNSGGHRKRLPRAQIAWGGCFHARGVRAGRLGWDPH
jgi:hypothetical protein